MGTPLAGTNGTVKIGSTATALVSSWELTIEANTSRFANNESSGWKTTLAGTKSGSGSIAGQLNTASGGGQADIHAGTSVTLNLYVDATRFYSMTAIIKSFKKSVDIDDGKYIPFTATFETSGAITQPTWA